MTMIEQWENGDVTDLHALRSLLVEYAEIESDIAPLDEERKRVRSVIERIVLRLDDGKAQTDVGDVSMSAPSTRVSYDTKALDTLLAKCVANGLNAVAEELASARKETTVNGSLRIKLHRK